MTFNIVVIGNYYFDEIYVGLPQFPKLGREVFAKDLLVVPGATFITAAVLNSLGANVTWGAIFGTDNYSQFVLKRAHALKIDLTPTRYLETPFRQVTTAIPFDGERAFVSFADPEPLDMQAYWLETLGKISFNHLHFSCLSDVERLPHLVALARKKGATVSTDCQDVPLLQMPDEAIQIIETVDIFLPNEREASLLAKTHDIAEAIEYLSRFVPIVVVKAGVKGAFVHQHNTTTHVASIAVDHVVDTTGAGDAFNAGFLYGYISHRMTAKESTLYGVICGATSVQGVGGASKMLTTEELSQHFKEARLNAS